MIKVGDKVLLKQGTRLMGVPAYFDDIFKVDFIMDKRVKIVSYDRIVWCSTDNLIPLENQVLTLKREKTVILDNGMGASVVIKTNDNKVIEVTLLTKVDGPESLGKNYSFGKIESLNNFLSSLGFKNTFQFEKEETAAEILEEMKRKAKPFNSATTNCVVTGNCVTGKVSTSVFSCVEIYGALYFEKEVAKDFAKRLQAAYEREWANND